MAGKSRLPELILTPEEQKRLETLQASRVAPVREVERARILLQYRAGNNPSAIQISLGISRVTIYHRLHKALEMGGVFEFHDFHGDVGIGYQKSVPESGRKTPYDVCCISRCFRSLPQHLPKIRQSSPLAGRYLLPRFPERANNCSALPFTKFNEL
jgi:hypothetical protein